MVLNKKLNNGKSSNLIFSLTTGKLLITSSLRSILICPYSLKNLIANRFNTPPVNVVPSLCSAVAEICKKRCVLVVEQKTQKNPNFVILVETLAGLFVDHSDFSYAVYDLRISSTLNQRAIPPHYQKSFIYSQIPPQ